MDYGRNSPTRGYADDRERNRGRMADYRQRSPPPRRGQSPPVRDGRDPYTQEKWVQFDDSLPNNSIKVYSRTLFVGGVT